MTWPPPAISLCALTNGLWNNQTQDAVKVLKNYAVFKQPHAAFVEAACRTTYSCSDKLANKPSSMRFASSVAVGDVYACEPLWLKICFPFFGPGSGVPI